MGVKRNDQVLKICIAVITAVFILCLIFVAYARLDEPVFFQNYCEYPLSKATEEDGEELDMVFRLSYIANAEDQSEAIGISFPQAPLLGASISEEDPNGGWSQQVNGQEVRPGVLCGRYAVRTAYVELFYDPGLQDGAKALPNPMELNTALITFQGGKTVEVDLGKISGLYNLRYSAYDTRNEEPGFLSLMKYLRSRGAL